MNFVTRWFIERRIQDMLTKLWTALDGSKTYLLALGGIVVALIGHFWGPVTVGPVQIPHLDWSGVWPIVYNSGLFAALRHGVGQ